jgi:hypothetical protein
MEVGGGGLAANLPDRLEEIFFKEFLDLKKYCVSLCHENNINTMLFPPAGLPERIRYVLKNITRYLNPLRKN